MGCLKCGKFDFEVGNSGLKCKNCSDYYPYTHNDFKTVLRGVIDNSNHNSDYVSGFKEAEECLYKDICYDDDEWHKKSVAWQAGWTQAVETIGAYKKKVDNYEYKIACCYKVNELLKKNVTDALSCVASFKTGFFSRKKTKKFKKELLTILKRLKFEKD